MPDGSGGFVAPGEVLASLVKNSDGTLTFTRRSDRIAYVFNASGQLASATDPNGEVTSVTYVGGSPSTITDSAGRTLSLTWTGSHVTSVTGPLGRTVTYAYVGSNLTEVHDPAGRVTKYAYDGSHQLTKVTYPDTTSTLNSYDSSGRVVSQTDPAGRTTTYSYTGDPTTTSGGSTAVTDAHGVTAKYAYAQMLLTSRTAAAGTSAATTTTFTHDPATGAVTSTADALGHTSSTAYDIDGNVIASTDADGTVVSYTYDSFGDVLSSTDPASGATATMAYDSRGNLTSSTDFAGKTTTYAHATSAHPGDVTSMTTPAGRTVSYGYDGYGDVSSTTTQPWSSVTNTATTLWDAAGERLCVADANATAKSIRCPSDGSWTQGVTTWAYNTDGQATSAKDPLGNVWSVTYDTNGRVSSRTGPAVTGAPSGRMMTSTYDADGRVVASTSGDSAASANTASSFDIAPGTANSGCPSTASLPGVVWCERTVEYSAASGSTNTTAALSTQATTTAFDARGVVVQVSRPGGVVTRYSYDAAGRMVGRTDPDGRSVAFTVDPDGLTTKTAYADGATVAYAYDADGRRVSMTDATGTSTRTLDADGRVVKTVDGAGNVVSYGLNADGDVYKLTYPGGRAVAFAYDGAGQQTQFADWNNAKTTYTYDHDGNIVSRTLGNGDTISSPVDGDGRPVGSRLVAAGGSVLASLGYVWDASGDLASVSGSGATAGSTGYGYDPVDHLASTSTGSTSSSYVTDDSTGNVRNLAGQVQVFSNGRKLTSATSAAGAVTGYSYNNDGARVGSGYTPAGGSAVTVSTSATYTQAGLMSRYTSTAGGSASASTYTYDGGGLRVAKTSGGATTGFVWQSANASGPRLLTAGGTAFVYGPDGLPAEQVRLASGATDWFMADQVGSTRVLTDASGAVAGTYAYTPHGVVTAHTGTDATVLGYTGGYTDAESGLVYLVNRYYDPATGVFTTIDPAVDVTGDPYGYAGANPVNRVDPLGLWSMHGWVEKAVGGAAGAVAGFVVGCMLTGCVAGPELAVAGAEFGAAAAAGDAAGGVAGALVGGWLGSHTSSDTSGGSDNDDDDSTCPDMPGANGTQVTSKTLTEGKSVPYRIDVENPDPGGRAGQIHYQQGAEKYMYDFDTGEFEGMPKNLAKRIARDPIAQRAIRRGLDYLGMR